MNFFCRPERFGGLCALLIVSVLFASSAWASVPGEGSRAAAARSVNAFALDVYRQLALAEKGDVFFSPYSIVSALGMTYAGARGETAAEMGRVLHAGEGFHASLGALVREFDKSFAGVEGGPLLATANRVWVQKGSDLRHEYADLLSRDYGGETARLDFEGDSKGARDAINAWVEERTRKRIRNLIQGLDPSTKLVLTNAVYFRADWANPFDEGGTKPLPFHRGSEDPIDVPTMYQREHLLYAEADGLQLLRLPYSDDLSMLVVLPRDAEGMERLAGRLGEESGPELVEQWRKGLRLHDVEVWLPKFRLEKRYSLNELLVSLGMGRAFGPDADFSGMLSEDVPLRIDQVVHQTFIELDERKTEAAAATAVVMLRATMLPEKLSRVAFRADRPFLYFILDDGTGTILFMGRQTFR